MASLKKSNNRRYLKTNKRRRRRVMRGGGPFDSLLNADRSGFNESTKGNVGAAIAILLTYGFTSVTVNSLNPLLGEQLGRLVYYISQVAGELLNIAGSTVKHTISTGNTLANKFAGYSYSILVAIVGGIIAVSRINVPVGGTAVLLVASYKYHTEIENLLGTMGMQISGMQQILSNLPIKQIITEQMIDLMIVLIETIIVNLNRRTNTMINNTTNAVTLFQYLCGISYKGIKTAISGTVRGCTSVVCSIANTVNTDIDVLSDTNEDMGETQSDGSQPPLVEPNPEQARITEDAIQEISNVTVRSLLGSGISQDLANLIKREINLQTFENLIARPEAASAHLQALTSKKKNVRTYEDDQLSMSSQPNPFDYFPVDKKRSKEAPYGGKRKSRRRNKRRKSRKSRK
jgi:hypothetical protein